MKDNHELRIKIDKPTHEKIKRNAEEVGMTIKNYILYLVTHSRVKVSLE